ncbi:ABC transporter ATP-binding protein [Reyranella sp. CPCC 100927]|nr:ABC transporter ATP-binding protein [Reyranella sp. CPCC 100927]
MPPNTKKVLSVVEPAAIAGPGRNTVIRIAGLSKRFLTDRGEFEALRGIDLAIGGGEFVCLLGASGCGKTTLLRILAGLDRHTDGVVEIRAARSGEPLTSVVFQEHSIFPWMTVWDNVAYGLRARRLDKATVRERVDFFVHKVGLTSFARSLPHQLSGGMKQRVSIARAFANDPEILLMDEPFSALDEQNRAILQEELLRIWSDTRKTVVFITHSIDEAVFLADRVVVLGGPPGHVVMDARVPFARPRNAYELRALPEFGALVADFGAHIKAGMNGQR